MTCLLQLTINFRKCHRQLKCSLQLARAKVTHHSPQLMILIFLSSTAVAQWLRCCVTNRKVAGSIPAGVIGIFH